MTAKRLLVLATGGTIAGRAGSATRRDYRPGQIGIEEFLANADYLELDVEFDGQQLAAIGSENMSPAIWREIHAAILAGFADDDVDAIVLTHGTDTAEETAILLDLTLPNTKPVVIVGAMRPADAVGSDGLRNFANAVRVAADDDAAGRGVLVVMSDRVLAARDVRKSRTSGTDAFAGFPRDAIAHVTPSSLEWFGPPWRGEEQARFAFPDEFPQVPVLYAYAGMPADTVTQCLAAHAQGIVLAGFGEGNMPDDVRAALAEAAKGGTPVVRSTRVDMGLVDRDPDDDCNHFIAARALGPAKARILLQLLLASGITDPAQIQAAFDRR
ncbi:MAG: asparaginase [Sphingomonadales bacterium CG12_big_fil_rev_8_21_14_0_65_65_10]|nr:MAG: asparaginase [Sphingomonadales bacterium CG12_big_fil_rev_8_21_14_0_65_65_10]